MIVKKIRADFNLTAYIIVQNCLLTLILKNNNFPRSIYQIELPHRQNRIVEIDLSKKYTRMEAGTINFTYSKKKLLTILILDVCSFQRLTKIYLVLFFYFTEHSTTSGISSEQFQFTTAANH